MSAQRVSSTQNATKRKRGRPNHEGAAELESRLLSVALAEFLKHGYGGTSMARIVKTAGVSKTTLYSRFPSKGDLFRAIVRQQIDEMSPATLLSSGSGVPDLGKGLKSYANHMLELSLQGDMLEVNRLMYSESARFPELGAAAGERTALGIKRIADFIRECAKADGNPCKNPKSVAEVFILMIRGWYVNVMLTNQKVSPSQRRAWVDRSVHTLLSSSEDW